MQWRNFVDDFARAKGIAEQFVNLDQFQTQFQERFK